MPQKPFDDSDAIPFDDSDAIPVEEPGAKGKWVKRGLTTMWVPDEKVDINKRPDTRWFGGYEALTEKLRGTRVPFGTAPFSVSGESLANFFLGALAEPDTLASGLGALFRPARPALYPPKENPVAAMEGFQYEPSMGVRLQYPQSAIEANSVNVGTSTITNRSIGSPPGAGETRLGFEPRVRMESQIPGGRVQPVVNTIDFDKPKVSVIGRDVLQEGQTLRPNQVVTLEVRKEGLLPYPLNVVPQAVQPRSAQAVTEALTPTKLVPGAKAAVEQTGRVAATPMRFVRGGFQVRPDGTFVDDWGNVIKPTTFKSTPAAEALKTTGEPRMSYLREGYELARGTTAAFDISAPFRQGIGLIGTRNWFKAWVPMFRAYGSEAATEAATAKIRQLPHVASGLAERAGMILADVNDFNARDEIIRSKLAEKLPFYIGKIIRRSNAAYTTFNNYLRAHTFNDWIDDAKAAGLDPERDMTVLRNIADTVNNLTGRGPFKFDLWLPKALGGGKTLKYEMLARPASHIFFAPKLMQSRINTLNPSTYMMLDPFTRKKALYGMMRLAAWWVSAAGIGRYVLGDESVSTDPTSADFGKIREGDARTDVAGGYQQYLVLFAKLLTGRYTSTVTGKTKEFGTEYGSETRLSTVERFASNKLHPTARFIYDLFQATTKRPVNIGDRLFQMYMPMIITDIMKIANEDPRLLPWLVPPAAAGMGTQLYEKGETPGVYLNPENDYIWKGGAMFPD